MSELANMTEILFIEPFERGYRAGIEGRDPRECPYDKFTKEYNEWQRAHRIGTRMTKEYLAAAEEYRRAYAAVVNARSLLAYAEERAEAARRRVTQLFRTEIKAADDRLNNGNPQQETKP